MTSHTSMSLKHYPERKYHFETKHIINSTIWDICIYKTAEKSTITLGIHIESINYACT